MKKRIQKGQLVRCGPMLVLVTAAQGDKSAKYKTFEGTVVQSHTDTDGKQGWPVGTHSATWKRSAFRHTKRKLYIEITTDAPARSEI